MSRRAVFMSVELIGNASAEPEFAFGVKIQRTPEHAIDDDDVETHHRNAQHDVVEIARVGLLRNIGAEPLSSEVLMPQEADSGAVPAFQGTAGGGDRPSHIYGSTAGS